MKMIAAASRAGSTLTLECAVAAPNAQGIWSLLDFLVGSSWPLWCPIMGMCIDCMGVVAMPSHSSTVGAEPFQASI